MKEDLLSAGLPLGAVNAAAPRQALTKVSQELLNCIHVTPEVILDPFPAYAEKFLPFAMAASIEVTRGGRMWTCWAGGEDGPEAYLLVSYSDDGGESWREPVFVIDPRAHGLPMGTRLGALWLDPKGRLWLFFHQSVGMFDGSCSNWFMRCDDPDCDKPAWSEPCYIGFGASLNKPIVRKDGEWILPVSLWERWHIDKPFADCYHELDAVRGANAFVSDDEGGHWRHRGGIIFEDSCFNEHSVVELNDGRLWMLSRCRREIAQSFSEDGGKTWQPQKTAFPHVNSKCVFRRLKSGSILLIKHGRDLTTTPKWTGSTDWGVRRDLTAFLSTDDGRTWSAGLLLDERSAVSYPDIAQAPNGDLYVHYDRNRDTDAEILFARFREADLLAGKLVSANAALKNIIKDRQGMNHGVERASMPPSPPAAKTRILPTDWDAKAAADEVLASLVKVTAPQVKGAHDAEFVCVGDRAYIVEHDNDVEPGHGAGAHEYCVLSVVSLKTLAVEKVVPMARSAQPFENETLPVGMCFVPRILQIDDQILRCYFASQGKGYEEQIWYRDFDLRTLTFEGCIHKAKLKTAAGVFDMQPRHFHADAAVQGFKKPATNHGLYLFDSFKQFDGKTYIALNNYPGKQNALALVHEDFATFEVIGHYNEPQSQQLSESAVNRLPDGTWMAICRNDGGNYHFTTSKDGRAWSVGKEMPFVPKGLNSKPTFDRFDDVYYLGWQEDTSLQGGRRSVFNIDISLDGATWERKYRFETPESFQYPSFHEHEGVIWLSVTQSDHRGSSDRIMFGRLEDVG